MITITVTASGLNEARRYIGMVDRRLINDRESGLFKIVNRIGDVWKDNFDSEGGRVNGWDNLAATTVQRRRDQGFGPEHPILERSGALKNVAIDSFTRVRSNRQFSKSDNYSDSNPTTASISVNRGVARLNATGWKVLNQEPRGHPARPFWFVDRTVMFAAQSGLVDWIVNDVLTP